MKKGKFTWKDSRISKSTNKLIIHCNRLYILLLLCLAKGISKKDIRFIADDDFMGYLLYLKSSCSIMEITDERDNFLIYSKNKFKRINQALINEEEIELDDSEKKEIYEYFLSVAYIKPSIDFFAFSFFFGFSIIAMITLGICLLTRRPPFSDTILLVLSPLYFGLLLAVAIITRKLLRPLSGKSSNMLANLEYQVLLSSCFKEMAYERKVIESSKEVLNADVTSNAELNVNDAQQNDKEDSEDPIFERIKKNRGYKIIERIMPETSIYFKALVDLDYLTMYEGEEVIKCKPPFSKNSFYCLLTDEKFLFIDKYGQFPNEAFKYLVGLSRNEMQRRAEVEAKKYNQVREALLSQNVPIRKE